MSLVSAITADMQYTMMSSDCEDKAADLAAKLKNIIDEGNDIGKFLTGIETNLEDIKSEVRGLKNLEYQVSCSRSPKAQSILTEIHGKMADDMEKYNRLDEIRRKKEVEKKSLSSKEKELTAQQKANDVMMKFSEGAAKKFSGFVDKSISRFFGGQ